MKKLEKVGSKYFDRLWVRGHWEMKRNKLRVRLNSSISNNNQGEGFIIDMGDIIEALKKANLLFVVEEKRVHKHLRLAKKGDMV